MMNNLKLKFSKSIQSLQSALAKIRTGRAHPSILDTVMVSFEGSLTPLNQLATIVVEDSRTLKVTAYTPNLTKSIDKAILNANLGLNPSNTGACIYVPLPALTEETRKRYLKQARQETELVRISIRNMRRYLFTKFKTQLKNKEINENDEKRLSNNVQKEVDIIMTTIDAILKEKEQQIMII